MFGTKPKITNPPKKELPSPTVGDLEKSGVKLNYSNLKKKIMQCELEGRDARCKAGLREIGIEVIDE